VRQEGYRFPEEARTGDWLALQPDQGLFFLGRASVFSSFYLCFVILWITRELSPVQVCGSGPELFKAFLFFVF
jgi:hypothetical protein